MGATYAVELKAIVKNGKKNAVEDQMKKYMSTIDCFKERHHVDVYTLELNSLLYWLFAGHQNMYESDIVDNNIYVKSYFDATCSWERVMYEMFEKIAPFLEDDSELIVCPDNDRSSCVVKDDKMVFGKWVIR